MDRVRPSTDSGKTAQCKTAVVVIILLLIALMHLFRLGTYLHGSLIRF